MLERFSNVLHWSAFLCALVPFMAGVNGLYDYLAWHIQRVDVFEMSDRHINMGKAGDVVDVSLANDVVIQNVPKSIDSKEKFIELLNGEGYDVTEDGVLLTKSGQRIVFPFDHLSSMFAPKISDFGIFIGISLVVYLMGWAMRYILTGKRDVIMYSLVCRSKKNAKN